MFETIIQYTSDFDLSSWDAHHGQGRRTILVAWWRCGPSYRGATHALKTFAPGCRCLRANASADSRLEAAARFGHASQHMF